jgi:hypothetical protein
MNYYNFLSEVESIKEKSLVNKDLVLDNYNKNPNHAKLLMMKLLELDKELEDLEKELQKIEDIQ